MSPVSSRTAAKLALPCIHDLTPANMSTQLSGSGLSSNNLVNTVVKGAHLVIIHAASVQLWHCLVEMKQSTFRRVHTYCVSLNRHRNKAMSPPMASALRLRSVPRSVTQRTFLQGHRHACNAAPQNLAEWLAAPKKWLAGIGWACMRFRSDAQPALSIR